MRFHHVSSKQTKITQKTTYRATIFLIAGVFAVTAIGGALMSRKITSADSFDDQIAAQQKTADSAGDKLAQALASAGSYDVAVKNLQSQQNDLEAQIGASNAKINNLNAQIAATQQQIRDASVALAKTSATIYAKQQSSGTLDILMNSRSVSDYVDALSQQNALKNQMTSSISKIGDLKNSLQAKKNQISGILKDQQAQKAAIAENQSQQQQLLDQANGDANAQQSTISAAKSKIADLKKQQAEANAAQARRFNGKIGASARCGGGYPYCNVGKDSGADPWGLYYRECVSYAAFKAQQNWGYMPYIGGHGNANEWPGFFRGRAGYTVSSTPKAGSVAIMSIGAYGHAAWVESVNGNGTVTVSQYNWDEAGNYSPMTVSAGAFYAYIYPSN